jgi:hypothetical protein
MHETARLISFDLLSNFEHSSLDFNCIFFNVEDGVKEISLPQLVSQSNSFLHRKRRQ